MSRTDLDPATLARSLRRMAGDGSVEWVTEPMQTRVLLDVADLLDENAKLREELESVGTAAYLYGRSDLKAENAKLRELAAKMARALGINSEWCDRDCEREFGCYCEPCPLDQALRELGVEVDG